MDEIELPASPAASATDSSMGDADLMSVAESEIELSEIELPGEPSEHRMSPAVTPCGLIAAFQWHFYAYGFLGEMMPFQLSKTFLGRKIRVSTCFSGIGCAEMGLEMVKAAAQLTEFSFETTSACDNSVSCQSCLRQTLPPDAHIFGDVMEGFGISKLPEVIVDWRQEWRDLALRNVEGRCCRHGVCRTPFADMCVAGSPCQFWSNMGDKRQHSDPRLMVLLCWCKQVRHFQYSLCVHENVKGFDAAVLTETLGDLYRLETLEIHPGDLGWGLVVSRPRLFTILVHREKALLVQNILEVFARVKERFRSLGPLATARDCLVARPDDLLEEENRVRALRKLPPLVAGSANWRYLFLGLILRSSFVRP